MPACFIRSNLIRFRCSRELRRAPLPPPATTSPGGHIRCSSPGDDAHRHLLPGGLAPKFNALRKQGADGGVNSSLVFVGQSVRQTAPLDGLCTVLCILHCLVAVKGITPRRPTARPTTDRLQGPLRLSLHPPLGSLHPSSRLDRVTAASTVAVRWLRRTDRWCVIRLRGKSYLVWLNYDIV